MSFPPTPHDLYNLSKVVKFLCLGFESLYIIAFRFFFVCIYLLVHLITSICHSWTYFFMHTFSNSLWPLFWVFFISNSNFLLIKCSCLGASLCFFLSYTLARDLVLRKFPDLFNKFNNMVRSNEKNLFWYMMFLRLTPLIPNWFVNLGSPLVGMPYIYFLVASMFGLMPNNFILIQTGLTLK
jgi:uncharacterized membrane protein YdjX (TVP38/TMEM64 family)